MNLNKTKMQHIKYINPKQEYTYKLVINNEEEEFENEYGDTIKFYETDIQKPALEELKYLNLWTDKIRFDTHPNKHASYSY